MVNKFLYPAGGAETYVFKLGEYWKKHGHEVEYFGMYHPKNIVGNRWELYCDSKDFHKKGIGANLTNPFKLIYSAEAKRKIRYILNVFQPDVMHINNFNYQLTPSILCAVSSKCLSVACAAWAIRSHRCSPISSAFACSVSCGFTPRAKPIRLRKCST